MSAIQIKKAYVDLPEGQIHYQYTKSPGSKTPIVFLHKSASSGASYSILQKHYAQLGHPTFAPDLPGFGSSFMPSSSPDEPLRTPWYCNILASVFSSLGLKTFHLVGHHAGACLTLELGVLLPDSVLSISLIGPTLMSATERQEMKTRFFAPFNAPVESGAHLQKTWDYLVRMGCPTSDLEMLQREFLDHARAWRGRQMIYGAVWEQDGQELFRKVKCKVLCLCAEDDVLWPYWHWVQELREDVKVGIIKGANFECDLDVEGVTKELDGIFEL